MKSTSLCLNPCGLILAVILSPVTGARLGGDDVDDNVTMMSEVRTMRLRHFCEDKNGLWLLFLGQVLM